MMIRCSLEIRLLHIVIYDASCMLACKAHLLRPSLSRNTGRMVIRMQGR